jgi:hypothetical protein
VPTTACHACDRNLPEATPCNWHEPVTRISFFAKGVLANKTVPIGGRLRWAGQNVGSLRGWRALTHLCLGKVSPGHCDRSVYIGGQPMTISCRNGRASIEVHSVRTAMKQGALGWPEQHMVVVLTQWRAGYFDKKMQKDKDGAPNSANDPDRDFKYRAGCTLLIDPQEMEIRRVIRTPGTVADGAVLKSSGPLVGVRLARLLDLRDCARRVLQSQNEGWTEEARTEARRHLNDAYDRFVINFGPINKCTTSETAAGTAVRRMPNLVKFREDPDAMLVMSLEDYDEVSGRAAKSAIMRQDVVGKKPTITSVRNAEEGLLVSLDRRGDVDLPLIPRFCNLLASILPQSTSSDDSGVTRDFATIGQRDWNSTVANRQKDIL